MNKNGLFSLLLYPHKMKPASVWECWLPANTDPSNYTVVNIDGKAVTAHTAAYKHVYGPVPKGHELHHRCEVKGCFNPIHLEAMTLSEHALLHKWPARRRTAEDQRFR
jgi:hypothetical protein